MNQPDAPFYQETVRIPRGDEYTRGFQLVCPGEDWTGITFTAEIREKPGTDAIYDAGQDATLSTGVVGYAPGYFTIPASVTESLPARCVLDARVSRPDGLFGPFTVFRLYLQIQDIYG